MSQSPTKQSSSAEILQYDKGWAAVNRMIRNGRSFSGRERNCCFLNLGQQRFATVSAVTELDLPDDGRGLAISDWDWDGRPDFWMTNRNGPRLRFMRNEYATDNQFLRIRLVGSKSNRDAIGARVELALADENVPRINTVRAGTGYLSQSSKWLHFGLGRQSAIQEVTVSWPGGAREEFAGLSPNGHFELVQGTGQAQSIAPPPHADWKPSVTPDAGTTPGARVVLLEPAPFPSQLQYTDLQGATQPLVAANHSQPLLINLWATWCPNCVKELREWRDASSQFKDANLAVLALSTDVRTELADDIQLVGDFARKANLPFTIGLTESNVVEVLNAFQRAFIGRQSDLPLPSSMLVDRHGRLAVIYKGPVSVEQVLHDVKLLDQEPANILAGAIPFAGKWIEPPPATTARLGAVALVENGYSEAAELYLRQLLPLYRDKLVVNAGPGADANADVQEDLKKEVSEMSHFLGAILYDKQDFQGAVEYYQKSLDLFPTNRLLRREQFLAMRELKDWDGAAKQIELLLEEHPDDAANLAELARLRRQQRRSPDAVSAYERSLVLQDDVSIRFELANTLRDDQQIAEAIRQYRQILESRPDSPIVANNLAWLLSTCADDRLRDGESAVKLADAAAQATSRRVPEILGTLAAAHAEVGDFSAAVAIIGEAIERAKEANKPDVVTELQTKELLYRSQRPYRTPTTTNP